ncbi:hypothetical protein [Novosphingobium sp.]|uniref:hypothetical protein n=1 Tax=Novosphingobium sp. TaxID=1874826 RepID=UPI002605CCE2|nr:hypothetical protein [Novosphingobium sp.]
MGNKNGPLSEMEGGPFFAFNTVEQGITWIPACAGMTKVELGKALPEPKASALHEPKSSTLPEPKSRHSLNPKKSSFPRRRESSVNQRASAHLHGC